MNVKICVDLHISTDASREMYLVVVISKKSANSRATLKLMDAR